MMGRTEKKRNGRIKRKAFYKIAIDVLRNCEKLAGFDAVDRKFLSRYDAF